MARTTTYLNFPGNTEAAFRFYGSVFGTEPIAPIARMGDVPQQPGAPALRESEKNLVMHVALPILGGHVLMGTDAVESLGHSVVFGTNMTLNLEPDTRTDTERLFARLAEGGKVDMPLQEMFWGSYFGLVTDQFGIKWMFNCSEKK